MMRLLFLLLIVSQTAFAKFGERVIVRKAQPEDFAALEKLFYTDEMREFYFMGEPKDPATWLEYSRQQPFVPFQPIRSRYFVIADPATNEFRGIITDITNNDTGEHELSYAIVREFRRNKLANDALDFMINQAFREDPDGVVTATVLASNQSSRELLLAKGFKQVGGFTMQMQVFELTLKCQSQVVNSP